jgi:hypothetical protein
MAKSFHTPSKKLLESDKKLIGRKLGKEDKTKENNFFITNGTQSNSQANSPNNKALKTRSYYIPNKKNQTQDYLLNKQFKENSSHSIQKSHHSNNSVEFLNKFNEHSEMVRQFKEENRSEIEQGQKEYIKLNFDKVVKLQDRDAFKFKDIIFDKFGYFVKEKEEKNMKKVNRFEQIKEILEKTKKKNNLLIEKLSIRQPPERFKTSISFHPIFDLK